MGPDQKRCKIIRTKPELCFGEILPFAKRSHTCLRKVIDWRRIKLPEFDMKKSPDYAFHSKTHTSPLPLVGNVSLPILPKPLSILKTAGKQLCNSKQTCKTTEIWEIPNMQNTYRKLCKKTNTSQFIQKREHSCQSWYGLAMGGRDRNTEIPKPRYRILSSLSQLGTQSIAPLIYFSPALLVAATHSTLGGDEEDGRKKICGIISYQLHRDIEAVSCSGEISNRYLTNFIFNTVSSWWLILTGWEDYQKQCP